jgi:flagellar biosynthetic protein FlhB
MPDLFDTQERTEEATPKRREEARERGQFARSPDLSTSILLLGAVALLLGFGPALLRGMGREIVAGVQRLSVPVSGPLGAAEVLRATLLSTAKLTLPFLVFLLVGGLLLHGVQAGGLFVARDAFAIRLDRFDPARNLARMLSLRSVGRVAGALLKLAAIVLVLVLALRGRLEEMGALARMEIETAAPRLGSLVLALLLRATAALFVLGCADWAFQRWQHARDLRMSKQQVRDEHKEEEGDPQVKKRLRDRWRRWLEKPLRQSVSEATVVVTNPTHVAVALQYLEGRSAAPTVVAKGVDRVAEEIQRIARDVNVPVVEQPPLARALFRDVPVGEPIPEALYRAVASVLAIVWRLREERARRGGVKPKARAAAGGGR